MLRRVDTCPRRKHHDNLVTDSGEVVMKNVNMKLALGLLVGFFLFGIGSVYLGF
ncbi:hypothetical protein [Sandarakinorhabdus cyanobacteriorum]|uniref:hypothetical protein n=1 Tax=Sandarakinorhabdus cyanobacteriorum TaxID=1981098 RepID=UPI0013FE3B40|nr:hypothetical protein [Sandarakinorhabdus cyanobacteriorum]